MTTYNAAFSALAVQTPFDGNGHRAPSLYCLNTAANTYDRYEWSGTKRPWSGDTPDSQGKLVGTSSADPGLFGHWAIPWDTVDGTLCVDPSHVYLFNGTDCIYYTLEATGTSPDRTPETDAVTDPMPISSVFGYGGAFPLNKIDAAFLFLTANKKKIWFFGGNQCYLIDATTHIPEDGFRDHGNPVALNINDAWPSLPDDLKNGLTWAVPVLDTNGDIQDRAYLDTGINWCPVIPSTKTATLILLTKPGRQPFTIPPGVEQATLELWGPGGNGGDGGAGGNGGNGGNGGAGAYIKYNLPVGASAVYIGAPGDRTSYSYLLVAGSGGGGGGGGAASSDGGWGGGNGGAGGGGDGGSGDGSPNGGTGGGGGTLGGVAEGGNPGGGGGGGAGGGAGGLGGSCGGGALASNAGSGDGQNGGSGGNHGGAGGGGGSQGPSNYPTGAVFKEAAEGSDARIPYMAFNDSTGFGGYGGKPNGGKGSPGGNGAARITW
ncbi:hypothetical protein [Streptomyces sp. BA2]|uniref:hypothetical protein n=1 Tax=Streptomyces sp. BA2 TaxID=436595 RepID=UPI0013245586|nr:hypothetical protein [Streptomyces sp. BA2]MWA07732.1 hypothetical protein [Streptomyces sp. BA2]